VVKPLLLYYGVAALSRGLMLAKQPQLSTASMRPSHGLETVDWQQALAENNFADLKVRMAEGAFLELLKATENKSYLKNKSSGVNWHVGFALPEPGTIICLDNLLKTFADLSDQYQKWQSIKIDYLSLNTFQHTGEDKYEYGFNLSTDKVLVERIFPEELFPGRIIAVKLGQLTVTTGCERAAQFTQRFFDPFQLGMGEIAITHRPSDNVSISTLGQFYCLSYYWGMLARYFPSTWVSLGRGVKGDAIFPLVRRSVDLIEHYFPMIVCEFLEGPYNFES
jgi:hypothetical protein